MQKPGKHRLRRLLSNFIDIYANLPDIMLDQRLHPRLWFMHELRTSYKARKEAAHYFLLAAALNKSAVVGNARNVRVLLKYVHDILRRQGESLYTLEDPSAFRGVIERFENESRLFGKLGPKKDKIPGILASVNKFVNQKANGDLIKYAEKLASNGKKPADMVEILAYNIGWMGGRYKADSWLYMKWMVRHKPDLGLFKCFSPKDLLIPLTTPVLRVGIALGLVGDNSIIEAFSSYEKTREWWENYGKNKARTIEKVQLKLTKYVKTFSPSDPVKVDHPFFVLGRWLEGFDLSLEFLTRSLDLFNAIHRKIQNRKPPIKYLVQVPHEGQTIGAFGSMERIVAEKLLKKGIWFNYEPLLFHFPGRVYDGRVEILWYKPDFILRKTIKGKKVILEPHGRWEERDIRKFSFFKKSYGEFFVLILIVSDKMLDTISKEREAYDYIWSIKNFERELDDLLKGECD